MELKKNDKKRKFKKKIAYLILIIMKNEKCSNLNNSVYEVDIMNDWMKENKLFVTNFFYLVILMAHTHIHTYVAETMKSS